MDIHEAAVYLGVGEVFTRKLKRTGRIHATSVPVKEGSKQTRLDFAPDDLDSYMAAPRKTGSHRADGRLAWKLYATMEEVVTITRTLPDMPAPQRPSYVDKGKSKRGRAK